MNKTTTFRLLILSSLTASLISVAARRRPATVTGVPQQIAVPERITCATCKFETAVETTLGAADGPASLFGNPIAVGASTSSHYWVGITPGLPYVFDHEGRFVSRAGARGKGPLELTQGSRFIALPGDSMMVLDAGAKAVVFDPDRMATREIVMPAGVAWSGNAANWPTGMVVNGRFFGSASDGWAIHFITIGNGVGHISKSLGPVRVDTRKDPSLMPLVQRMTTPRNGSFWSASQDMYRLTEWSAKGGVIQSLRRQPPWFSRTSRGVVSRVTPPDPYIVDVSQDETGRLWVASLVPDRRFKDAFDTRGGSDQRADRVDFSLLYDTRIDVIDPQKRVLIATFDLPDRAINLLPGNRIATYRTDPDGNLFIDIIRIRLRDP